MHVLYPGSFDPPTLGHLHIVERASQLFEKVTIFVAVNPDKHHLLSLSARKSLLTKICKKWKNVHVDSGKGLLIQHAERLKADAIVKGIRGTADLEMERTMAAVNNKIGDGIETVFLLSHENHALTSSSLVKQVFKLGGDISSFVPVEVSQIMKKQKK